MCDQQRIPMRAAELQAAASRLSAHRHAQQQDAAQGRALLLGGRGRPPHAHGKYFREYAHTCRPAAGSGGRAVSAIDIPHIRDSIDEHDNATQGFAAV